MSKTILLKEEVIRTLEKNDPVLKPLIAALPWPTSTSTQDIFHDLMSCLIEQQIHYRSTKKTFQKILEAAEIERVSLDNFEVFEEKGLAEVKLSNHKYQAILALVEFFESKSIDWTKLSEEEIRRELINIKGISHWSIDMILLFTLERPDIFPGDDYHLKQIMSKEYGLNAQARLKAQMKEVAEKWRPYRSWGVKYLWAWKNFHKKR